MARKKNQLILGECLDVLKKIDTESIDLVYADPPFIRDSIYNSRSQSNDIEKYILWFKPRMKEMVRILKPTGSLLVHCDTQTNAYVKVYLLDKFFERKNFRNEIVWYYQKWIKTFKRFQHQRDMIYWYSKSEKYTFNKDESASSHREKIAPREVLEFPTTQSSEKNLYTSQHRAGFVQKLLLTATNEWDTIVDCFAGNGAMIAAAEKTQRHWIGIDSDSNAIRLTEHRLHSQVDLFSTSFATSLDIKLDSKTESKYEGLFDFKKYILQHFFGANISVGKSRDEMYEKTKTHVPIFISANEVTMDHFEKFKTYCEQHDKPLFQLFKENKQPIGYIIAFGFANELIQEVFRLQQDENIILELILIDNVVS